jgi:pyridoxal phosphate enzyme (YggS family)
VATIETRIQLIRQRITAACERAGRDPGQVRLLPVSKTHPPAKILEAFRAGCTRFGENKVQEAAAKAAELEHVEGLEWSLIGHLQTNKARQLVTFAAEFQALDSIRLARELQKRLEAADRTLDVLVQVNSSGEATKFGLEPDEVVGFAAQLAPFDRLAVRGLMTLAANTPDREVVAGCFETMRDLQTRLRDAHGGGWDELSMGMSGDYELAIEHGSTCVRIGTAIFGERPPANP